MLSTHGNKITFVGHATFLVTTPSGQTVLIDPWTEGNPACPKHLKKLPRVDTILITHGHTDHIGDLLSIAKEHKPHIVAMNETCGWIQSKGIENLHPLNKGGTVKVGDIEVTMVDARHSNGIDDGGTMVYGGEAAGLIVRFPGGFVLYHAGDTSAFGDMKLIGEMYTPHLALLPIGDNYTMGPREAAFATRLLGVGHVVPMHYGTFPLLTGTPEGFRKATRDIEGLEIHEMKPGETIDGK